jgi:predicted TIM-barrel fold metal-dependent hydrolase
MPRKTYRIFDADVHHVYPSYAAIADYLPSGTRIPPAGRGRAVPHVDGAFRIDTVTPSGGLPGSDPEFMARDHLDRHGIDYALLSCGSVLGLSTIHDVDFAVALQRAVNDWTIEEWFSVDERYLGSITVTTSDPYEAACEIRRLGSHPRIVQVCATGLQGLMGHASMFPIYEACAEVGLPFTMHVGFEADTLVPTTFVEVHVDMCFAAFPNLASLVLEGVFEKFPTLKVVFNEYGMGWVPFAMWRLDMEYRAGRDEVPWLTRLPSEYIADHVRFTTQPLEEPNDPGDLAKLLSLFPAERMLLFSSDYPHWDADSPEYALRNVPEEWRERIFFDNACETFPLGERLGVQPVAAVA